MSKVALDAYFEIQNRLLEAVPTRFERYLHSKINWDARMIGITGFRGVGKTTLLLQRLAKLKNRSAFLYISADNPLVLKDGIYNIGDTFFKYGGKLLIVDEAHRYPNWSLEVKALYDAFPGKQLIFTGSSTLEITMGKGDLSRRAVIYNLNILSFREYLQIRTGDEIAPVPLDELLVNHTKTSASLLRYEPLKYFAEYLQHGAYPYFVEGDFHNRILNTLDKVVYDDILGTGDVKPESAVTVKKLIAFLATSAVPRVSPQKLSNTLGITKPTLYNYLDLMERVGLVIRIPPEKAGHKLIRSGAKVFLSSPNLYHVLGGPTWHLETKLGTIREAFVASQLAPHYPITVPKNGDFAIRLNGDRIVFEVGGLSKTHGQVKIEENAFILKDGVETGHARTIPLYLIGMIY